MKGGSMKLDSVITADMRINEVIRRYPKTVGIFHALGLDACCGGDKTITDAASAHGLTTEVVLQSLHAELVADG
jgi:iron-sulfur cluster repair protein YtfE (RIC family)